jgi:hypothetical protein
MANENPVGQALITNTGRVQTSATDANTTLNYRKVMGDLSTPGQWRIMEQTCPTISVGKRARIDILQGVKWDVASHEDTPEEVVEYVREMLLERMVKRFEQVARNCFEAPGYGAAPQEITTYVADGKLWVRDLDPRPIQTFEKHTVRENEDGFIEGTQRFYDGKSNGSTLKSVEYGTPGEDGKGWLFWVTWGYNGSIFGEGFYRSLYTIYLEWADAIRYRRIATQKASLGVPCAFAREGTQQTKDERDAAAETLGDVTTHELGAFIAPDWMEKIEWTFTNGEAIDALTEVLRDCEMRMLIMFGAQYAGRGTLTGTGTNAAGEVDSRELKGHRQAQIDWLSSQIQPLINIMVDENFGEQKHYPSLVGSVPYEINPSQFVDSLVKAAAGNTLIIDKNIRDEVRRALKLEPEGDEVEEILAEKQEQADALRAAVANKVGDDKQDPESDDEDPATLNKERQSEETVKEDETEDMTARACSCSHHFQGELDNPVADITATTQGLRKPPRPGGQKARRTGPNGRDLSRLERMVPFNRIELTLDSSKQTMLGVLMDAREAIAKDMLSQVQGAEWTTGPEAAKALQKVKPSKPLLRRLRKMIAAELKHVSNVASETVDTEREEQTGDFNFSATIAFQGGEFEDVTIEEALEEAQADTRAQLVRAAIGIVAPSKAQVFDLLRQASAEMSQTAASNTATLATTETFARARLARANEIVEQTGERPVNVWYSAVLDQNTCDPCARADQEHGEDSGDPLNFETGEIAFFMPPFQECMGGVRCRCQLVFEWS